MNYYYDEDVHMNYFSILHDRIPYSLIFYLYPINKCDGSTPQHI